MISWLYSLTDQDAKHKKNRQLVNTRITPLDEQHFQLYLNNFFYVWEPNLRSFNHSSFQVSVKVGNVSWHADMRTDASRCGQCVGMVCMSVAELETFPRVARRRALCVWWNDRQGFPPVSDRCLFPAAFQYRRGDKNNLAVRYKYRTSQIFACAQVFQSLPYTYIFSYPNHVSKKKIPIFSLSYSVLVSKRDLFSFLCVFLRLCSSVLSVF
jgi:hypothetical protein